MVGFVELTELICSGMTPLDKLGTWRIYETHDFWMFLASWTLGTSPLVFRGCGTVFYNMHIQPNAQPNPNRSLPTESWHKFNPETIENNDVPQCTVLDGFHCKV